MSSMSATAISIYVFHYSDTNEWTPVVDGWHYLTCQFKYNCSSYLISGIFGTKCDLDDPSESFRNLSITDTGESESGNPGTSGKF